MTRPLSEIRLAHAPSVGVKAARLGELMAAGFAVPRGFVLSHDLFDANGELARMSENTARIVRAAGVSAPDPMLASLVASLQEVLAELGDAPLVVRSSVIDEDNAVAGVYDSILDVRGEGAVIAAIGRVQGSARSPHALALRGAREPSRMAVIVQQMIRAQTAGVAFTADPITGERERRVISVITGGQETEEWIVEGGRAKRRRSIGPILQERRVLEIARVAQEIADRLGAPQEVEWAIDAGGLAILQARPIAALPERVEWNAPVGRAWLRNVRYGEWLAEPVSPLFATWFLARADEVFVRTQKAQLGVTVDGPCSHLVNGWYYGSPPRALGAGTMVRMMVQAPRTLRALRNVATDPHAYARHVVERRQKEHVERLLPAYRALAARPPAHDRASAVEFLEDLTMIHGELLFDLKLVSGLAWRAERALEELFREHLAHLDESPARLVAGLWGVPEPAPHLVCSLDWMHPTLGELAGAAPEHAYDDTALREARETLEGACREALAERPDVLARFDSLLALARDYAAVREEQARDLTLAWPNARAALRVLGEDLVARGLFAAADDIHFVQYDELAGNESLHGKVAERRARWQRQRRMAAPLSVGDAPGTGLVGAPASPGRATASARILRTLSELGRFHDGEVLVVPTSAPGWMPLVARAAAIVIDGGSLAAQMSLGAREVGIPAVVATGDATHRLHDGQVVTVDGTRGVVELDDQ